MGLNSPTTYLTNHTFMDLGLCIAAVMLGQKKTLPKLVPGS